MQLADIVGLVELMSDGVTAVIMAVGEAAITAAMVGQVTAITARAMAIHTTASAITVRATVAAMTRITVITRADIILIDTDTRPI
jgi:hypothetical protein